MIRQMLKKSFAAFGRRPFYMIGIRLLTPLLAALALFGFFFLPVAAVCVIWLLEAGLYILFLNAYSEEHVELSQLFQAFRNWKTAKRILCGLGWQALHIFLWMLIPVVGWIFAIIKVYSYRLTLYILVTEPEIEAKQAIYVSENRTFGYRGIMFGVDVLAFTCPAVVVFLFGLLVNIHPLFSILVSVLALFFVLVVPPLYLLVHAGFATELSAPREEVPPQIPADF